MFFLDLDLDLDSRRRKEGGRCPTNESKSFGHVARLDLTWTAS